MHLIRLRGLCRYSLIDTEYQVGQRSNWMKTRHTFGIILSSDSFSSDLFQVKYSPDLGISYHGVERSNITYSRYFELGFKLAKQHKPLLPWCSCHDELIWYSLDNDPREKSLWEIKDATDPSVSGIIKPHQHQNVQILYLTHNTRYIRIFYLTMRHNTTNIRSVRTNIFLDITVPKSVQHNQCNSHNNNHHICQRVPTSPDALAYVCIVYKLLVMIPTWWVTQMILGIIFNVIDNTMVINTSSIPTPST